MNLKIKRIENVEAEIKQFAEHEIRLFKLKGTFEKSWRNYHAKGQNLTFSYLQDGEKVIGILGFIFDKVKNSASLLKTSHDPEEKYTWLMAIAIDEQYRGKGLGNKLMEHYVELSKEGGATVLGLRVEPDNNNAIDLYKKFNFVEYDRSTTSVMMSRKV